MPSYFPVNDQEGTRTRIESIRDGLNLSINEFATRMDMSRSGLGQVLSGRNRVSPRLVKLVCETYHINSTWLLTGEGSPTDPEEEPQKADAPTPAQIMRDALIIRIQAMKDEEIVALYRLAQAWPSTYKDVENLYILKGELEKE